MRCTRPGFSLVEVAIVILIVGLIVSAMRIAQEIRTNASLQSTVVDAIAVGAATAVFIDRYGGMPGDLKGAADRIPGCIRSESCGAPEEAPTTGDGNVGEPGRIVRHQTAAVTAAERETLLFWSHLVLGELAMGMADEYASSRAPVISWSTSHPAAPIGGGFHVKDSNGGAADSLPGWPPGAQQPDGTFLVLQAEVSRDLVPALAGHQVLNASQAAWIDRKMDDGNPFNGYVVGYGPVALPMTGAGCFVWTAVDRGIYDETDAGRNCGLAFRLGP